MKMTLIRPRLYALFPACAMSALVLLLGTSAARGADGSDLVHNITTERSFYGTGEVVSITASQCNPTDEVITLVYGCPCCHSRITIHDEEGEEIAEDTPGCLTVVVTETWEPGECREERTDWPQVEGFYIPGIALDGTPVDPGIYFARFHWWHGGLEVEIDSDPILIEPIYTPAVPTLSGMGAVLLASLLGAAGVLRFRKSRRSARPD